MSSGIARPRSAIRMIAAAIISIGFLFAFAPSASAHTELEASSPADGGSIGAAPSQLLLNFSEPILDVGARIVVQGPDGHEYQAGPAQVVDTKLTQSLMPLGPTGEYRVDIRVTAADGHPNTFGTRFTLTQPGPAAGGAKAMLPPTPPVQVPLTLNNAPSWAPWVAVAAAVILASGAVLFGRRATHDLD